MMYLKINPLNEIAREMYANHGHFHEGDAGLDLYVLEDLTIEPGETKAIKLGLACEPTDGRAYFLLPRSSISKTPLRLANSIGLIDGGYRGELMAMCDNIKDFTYIAEKGQRLFQLVACDCSPISYELVEELSETTRGAGGFGSTGK
jgi:dUTP pyrophosphatase